MAIHIKKWLLFFCFICCFSGCHRRSPSLISKKFSVPSIPLFIQLPENTLVFENFASIIYPMLVHHFKLKKYDLKQSLKDSYALVLEIENFSTVKNFLSDDVVLLHSIKKLDLLCSLLDKNQHRLATKKFSCTVFVSPSSNPLQNEAFLFHEIEQAFRSVLPRIEFFVRHYFISNQVHKQ